MVYWSNRDKWLIRQLEKRKVTVQEHNYKTETRPFQVSAADTRTYTMRSKRESWFARLCEILVQSKSVLRWWYEPHQFRCGTIYRKERVYTPDFLLELGDDDIFDTGTRSVWVEVKSTLDQKAVSRQRWFHQAYPDIPVLLMVDQCYDSHASSKAAKRQRELQSKASKYVHRILYGTNWYK